MKLIGRDLVFGKDDEAWRRKHDMRFDGERFYEDEGVPCECRSCGYKTTIYTGKRDKKGPFICPKCRTKTLFGKR